MIEKNLEALKAGRELDALVSRRIFGECPHLETIQDYANEEICKECGDDIFDYVGDYDDDTVKYVDSDDWHCPDYSTDLNAAFVVVCKLIQASLSLRITFTLMSDGESFLATFCSVAGAINYKASSPALAICKAAMMFYAQFFEGDKEG